MDCAKRIAQYNPIVHCLTTLTISVAQAAVYLSRVFAKHAITMNSVKIVSGDLTTNATMSSAESVAELTNLLTVQDTKYAIQIMRTMASQSQNVLTVSKMLIAATKTISIATR